MASYSFDYSGVNSSANKINSYLSNLDNSLKTFSTHIADTQGIWKGKSGTAFTKKMEEKYNKIQTLVNKLHEVSSSLSKISQRADAAETEIVNQINNM